MIQWNEVTWYSRWGAVILFLVVVPILCFYIGTQYEAVLSQPQVALAPTIEKSATPDLHYYVDQKIDDALAGCRAHTTYDQLTCIASSTDAYRAILNTKLAMVLSSLDKSAAQNPDLAYYSSQDEKINYFQDEKTQVQAAEASWESYVKATCTAADDEWTGGSGHAIGYGLCEISLIQRRIYDLCETGSGPKNSRCDPDFIF